MEHMVLKKGTDMPDESGMVRDDRFLRREYLRTLIPVMFSVLAGTINTLIDSAFVAQRIGNDALAAVNMCGPLYQVICTLGSLLAGGASILSSQEAGKDEMEKSRVYYHTALFLGLVLGAAATAAGILFCDPAARLLSQGGELTGYVREYCFATFAGLIPVVIAYIPLYYLQLEGRGREIMVMMAIVIGVDVVLDWVFLYLFDFGMGGAAAASVLSMAASCVYGFAALQGKHSAYRFDIRLMGIRGWRELVTCGSPVAVGNLLDAVRLFLLNALVLAAAGAKGAAIWAVLNSLSELSLCISSGVPQAAGPMIAVFYSVRENSGIRILMRLQMKVGMVLTGAFVLALLLFHSGIQALFALPEPIFLPLLCLGISLFFELICSVWSSFFNSTDQILLSNVLIGMKRFFFPAVTALALAVSGGWLWAFLPLSGVLSVIGSAAAVGWKALRSQKTSHPLSGLLLLDDYLEREGLVLDFSIEPTEQKICDASERIKVFCTRNHMDRKGTNRLGMAIEELLVVMKEANPEMKSVDLRVFALESETGIRIRSAGERYNPFEMAQDGEDLFYLGVTMLQNMAEEISYSYTLGMNTLYLSFSEKGEERSRME